MLFNCVICSDIFDSASETYVTTCGHLFHYVCLIEWLERSKSCPQCRNKTTEASIVRVFFNVQNEDKEDAGSLRNQIENLKFAVQMKELEVKNASDEVKTMRNRNIKLKKEFKGFEEKVAALEATAVSLKEQVKYLKKQVKDGEDAKEAAGELRKKLEMLQNVELAVKGTTSEVEVMLNSYSGTSDSYKAIITYAAVLKRELNSATERRRELRVRVDELQRSLSAAQAELEQLRAGKKSKELALKVMEDDHRHLEEENKSLARKLRELEQAIVSPSADPRNSALRRLIAESPAPEALKRPRLTDPNKDCKENVTVGSSLKLSGGQAPHPRVGSPTEVGTFLGLSSRRTRLFREVPRAVAGAELCYDGLGGHSRRDDFPVPVVAACPKLRLATLRKKVLPLSTLDSFVNHA